MNITDKGWIKYAKIISRNDKRPLNPGYRGQREHYIQKWIFELIEEYPELDIDTVWRAVRTHFVGEVVGDFGDNLDTPKNIHDSAGWDMVNLVSELSDYLNFMRRREEIEN